MPTPAERKALLFLAAVGVLGGAVRMVGRGSDDEATGGERRAIARQLAAVDSASGAERARDGRRGARRRSGTRGGGSSRARTRDVAHDTAKVTARAVPVDVDVADAAALEALPGIGPALARRIVEDRARHGAFGSVEGLQRVRGIGPALAERLRAHVTFSGIPRLPDAAPRRAP